MVKMDMTNKVFGKLKVIKYVGTNKYNKGKWLCQCECGNTAEVLRGNLMMGYTTSCGCNKRKINKDNWCWKGHGEIAGQFWAVIKCNAKKRNLPFEVSIEDAWNLFIKQQGRCALTGMDLKFGKTFRKNKETHTASLDRIDNSKGYVNGNIQWVHKIVNKMRNNIDIDTFKSICEKVYKYDNTNCGLGKNVKKN